jgi:hypothetical protein
VGGEGSLVRVRWVEKHQVLLKSDQNIRYLSTLRHILSYLDAGLLASSQYPEGPATDHLGTGFILVSLCLIANAEMVPKTPSCHYMLLM